MRRVRSVTFGDLVQIAYVDDEDVRSFAMVHRTLVLDSNSKDHIELVTALEEAASALLEDVLEDVAMTEPWTPDEPEPEEEDEDE